MPVTNWGGGNGDFNNPANWNNGVPSAGVDATINGSSAAPITVTYGSGADIANTLNTGFTSLAMSGGSLVLQYGSNLQNTQNAFTQTGGLLEFQNGESLGQISTITGNGSAVQQTGGTIQIDQGTLILNGNSSFAGTITGGITPLSGGTLLLTGGAAYSFNKGAVLSTGALLLQQYGTSMFLGTSLTYRGALQEQNATTLALGGHTLTLNDTFTASDQIGGLVTGGTLLNLGAVSLNGGAAIDNGATLENRHALLLSNYAEFMALGTGAGGTALLQNDAGGVVRLQAGGTMITSLGDAEIVNAGLFQATAQNVTTVVQAAMTNSGTLSVGKLTTLELYDPLTNSGTISGAGTVLAYNSSIELDTGSVISSAVFGLVGASSLSLGANLAYGGNFLEQAFGNTASLALNGYTLTLNGGASFTDSFAFANVTGPGMLALAGSTTLADFQLGGTALLSNAGNVVQTGLVQIGDSSGAQAGILNAAGGRWTLAVAASIAAGSNTQSGFLNQGVLGSAVNSGNSTITALFTNSGTVTIGAGSALNLADVADNTGLLTGAGTLEIAQGSLELDAGTVLNVANFGFYANTANENGTLALGANITYGGAFSDVSSGNAVIDLDTYELRLTGNTFFSETPGSVVVNGPGTLSIARAASLSGFTLGGGATLNNTGTISQSGAVQIGDATAVAATVANATTGVWNLTADAGISPGATNSSTFANAGLLAKTGGSGFSTISLAFTNTGTVASNVAGGGIMFTGGGTFGGTLAGKGAIDFGAGRTYGISSGASLAVGTLGILGGGTDLVTSGAHTYAGTLALSAGATLTLGGKPMTLTGTSLLQGTVNGSGSMVVSGRSAVAITDGLILGGAVVLQDKTGTFAQQAGWTIGDSAASTAKLQILARSLYEIANDSGIATNGLGAIANAGIFEKAAGSGISVISPAFSNSGTVASQSGTLQFNAGFTNTGLITASGGSGIAIETSLLTAPGGAGTISLSNGGTALFAGYTDSGQTLQFADGSPNEVLLVAPGTFNAAISGFAGQDEIDVQNIQAFISGYAGDTTGGTLTLSAMSNGITSTVASLHFIGNYNVLDFATSSDGAFGTLLQVAGGADIPLADFAPANVPSMAETAHVAASYFPALAEDRGTTWLDGIHHAAR